jgi:hypothetical protein
MISVLFKKPAVFAAGFFVYSWKLLKYEEDGVKIKL